MAENSEVFQEKMDAGYTAAWEEDWPTAVKEFSQAVQVGSEDAEAHIQLGLALLNMDRLDDALRVYLRARQLSPNDPAPLERVADVLERMGRLDKAAQQFIAVADIYLKREWRDISAAVRNWERATQLTPGLTSVHIRLAWGYEKMRNKRMSLYQHLMVAYNCSRSGDAGKAIEAVESALKLNKRSKQGLNMLRALRGGQEVFLPDPPKQVTGELVPEEPESQEPEPPAAPSLHGPMGEAMNMALVSLAAHVVESGSLDAAGGDALQAMELQRQDRVEEAIGAYQRAESRFRHPALKMNLGVLLFLNNQPEEAVKHLGEALSDPALSSGALHALGYSYYDLGEHKKASRYLIQSLQAIDTKSATNQGQISELTEIYGRVLDALDGRSGDTLEAVNRRFISWLSSESWKQHIPDLRKQIETILDDGGDIVEFIEDGDSQQISSQLALIDKYTGQNLWTLAMSAAFTAVEIAPNYLPVHVRIATILMREGRLRQAILKYNIIARAYMARDEKDRAAAILAEVLEMAPMDVSVRLNLINLLEQEDRLEDVLVQHIELAKTHNKLGNFELARETYQKAEHLAIETDAAIEQVVIIKHSLADMAQIRLDTSNSHSKK
jgi:tetratricopeptide (TPR) repeat protein